MARGRIDPYWIRQVNRLAEAPAFLNAGRGKIFQELSRIGAAEFRNDYPSERKVGDILKEHRDQNDSARAQYREFHWPQAMGTPDLPWEASRFAIELVEYYRRHYEEARPTIGYVRWHWRLSLAFPLSDSPLKDTSMPGRDHLVAVFLTNEAIGRPIPLDTDEHIDHWLRPAPDDGIDDDSEGVVLENPREDRGRLFIVSEDVDDA